MWAIDIVQQYYLFAQIMTTKGQLEDCFLSGLTAYLENTLQILLLIALIDSHIENYVTTMSCNLTNLRIYIMYFKEIVRINEHLFHPV